MVFVLAVRGRSKGRIEPYICQLVEVCALCYAKGGQAVRLVRAGTVATVGHSGGGESRISFSRVSQVNSHGCRVNPLKGLVLSVLCGGKPASLC